MNDESPKTFLGNGEKTSKNKSDTGIYGGLGTSEKKDTIGGEREWFSRGEGSAEIYHQAQCSQLIALVELFKTFLSAMTN